MQRVCPECQRQSDEVLCPHDGTQTVRVGLGPAGLVGQVISGRYRVEKLIGEGGFGAVYGAVHTGTGDVVAIKVLRNDQQGSPEMAQRFQQEASVTAKLKQPHTVRVFDFGQMDSGDLFIAMEFLEGRVLTGALAGESPMHYRRLANIASQVLKSLAEAHEKGLVHRDLKPDNIFLQKVHGEEDFVKVLDFGIAKSLLGGETGAKTATGVIIGTPPYMSPEQARGTGVDVRTDIYALGCILYEALTGETAFPAESPIETLIRRITESPPRAHERCKRPTPAEFCDVVVKAMATQADQRYSTALEMAKALNEAALLPEPAVTMDPAAWDETLAGNLNVLDLGSGMAPALTGRAPAIASPTWRSPTEAPTTAPATALRPASGQAPAVGPGGAGPTRRPPGAPPVSAARPVEPTYSDGGETVGFDVVKKSVASAVAVQVPADPLPAPGTAPVAPEAPAQGGRGPTWLWAGVGFGAVIGAAAVWWFLGRSPEPPPAPAAVETPAAGAVPARPSPPDSLVPAGAREPPALAPASAPAPAPVPVPVPTRRSPLDSAVPAGAWGPLVPAPVPAPAPAPAAAPALAPEAPQPPRHKPKPTARTKKAVNDNKLLVE